VYVFCLQGDVEFDPKFEEQFKFGNSMLREGLRTMCLICQHIANNTDLVRKGSAQCFPSYSKSNCLLYKQILYLMLIWKENDTKWNLYVVIVLNK